MIDRPEDECEECGSGIDDHEEWCSESPTMDHDCTDGYLDNGEYCPNCNARGDRDPNLLDGVENEEATHPHQEEQG